MPPATVAAWWPSVSRFRVVDMAEAIRRWAEAESFLPKLSELLGAVQDVAEDRARAAVDIERWEAWKRANERGIEAGPRPEQAIPAEVKAQLDRFLGRVGENPDRPTMSRREQLRRLAAAYCCHLHSRRCEPPSELCCEGCPEVRHPDHPEGVPCVLGVTAE
jgi:hypothetical protein